MLISQEELDDSKYNSKIPFECVFCKSTFYTIKKYVDFIHRKKGHRPIEYCSQNCWNLFRRVRINYNCEQCSKSFSRIPSFSKKSKHVFCGHSCAAKYSNSHKTTGCRRSKLEYWIENELSCKYPNLKIEYNKVNVINAELDIFIPDLKLAFELNGIFHYEPVYGEEKLMRMKTNDTRKFQACSENGISLCILDTYNVKYLKKERDKKFLDIIVNIIEEKLQS